MGTLGHLLLIAVAYAIVNNVVLSQFLGICPFLGVSKNTKNCCRNGWCGNFRYHNRHIRYTAYLQFYTVSA